MLESFTADSIVDLGQRLDECCGPEMRGKTDGGLAPKSPAQRGLQDLSKQLAEACSVRSREVFGRIQKPVLDEIPKDHRKAAARCLHRGVRAVFLKGREEHRIGGVVDPRHFGELERPRKPQVFGWMSPKPPQLEETRADGAERAAAAPDELCLRQVSRDLGPIA